MLFKLAILLILASVLRVHGACDDCDPDNRVACYNETSYMFCFDEEEVKPSDTTTYNCPNGTFCVQTNSSICIKIPPNDTTVEPTCISQCGRCSENRKFACMSSNEFAMCYGTETPQGQNMPCPDGRVCSREAPNICVIPDANNPNAPSCGENETATIPPPTPPSSEGPPTNETSSTPPTIPTPNNICRDKGKSGRYPLPGDTTRRRYIYCYQQGGSLIGREFECPNFTYFNPNNQVCETS